MKNRFYLLVLLTVFSTSLAAQDLQEIFGAGLNAYEQKNYPDFLTYMRQADSLRKNHPVILTNLAKAFALNNQQEDAINILTRVAYMDASVDIGSEDFSSLQQVPSYLELKQLLAFLKTPIKNSQTFLELPDKTLHPEGIAYHKKSNTFFVSSLHQRKVLMVDGDKSISVFYEGEALFGIMGMAVDQEKDLLWVCSTAVPQMQGYKESMDGKASILCFDIKEKGLIRSYPVKDAKAWLGDLALSLSGEVYCTSSLASDPAIYKVNVVKGATEKWLAVPELISLQGITFEPKSKRFYLADYRYGIFTIDTETKSISLLKNKTKHPLKGIDGLYYHKNSLIAICNGLTPFQIVKFELDNLGNSLEDFAYLDKALSVLNEPTLGTIVNNTFYYIANSPWGAYDKSNKQISEKLSKPLILKVKL